MTALSPDVPVFRFAPSPNGRLHLGHAYSALASHELCRRVGGRFLLRIEDIDVTRTKEEFVEAIFEDLAWLGVAYETPVLRQSNNFAMYRRAAERLGELGVLYPCFATRAAILEAATKAGAGRDPDGAPLYTGLHKRLSSEEIAARKTRGDAFALRLDMEKACRLARTKLAGAPITFVSLDEDDCDVRRTVVADPARWGDAVVVRKDVPASYHLAVVVDDAAQGVTHVTRGKDLYAATDLHRLLQVLLDLPEPVYWHHRLITDLDGRKLAKSGGDTSLSALRAQGASVNDIRRLVGLA